MSDSDVAAIPDGAAGSHGRLNDPDKTTRLRQQSNRDAEMDLSGTMSSSQALSMTLAAPPHLAPAVDLTDCVLDEFRLLRRLGSGGMAQVYLAEQTSLKRTVAIKVMRADFGGDDSYEQRFEHEARAAAGLNHPNIVQVFAIGQCDEIHYIAQEYVQGLNLRQYLQKSKPPTANIAVHLMKQVCSALHVAHKAGIVHRDIKPENIMVTRRMTAKVTDFGLAQLTLGGERVNLTQRGVTMGTPMYMSPEQVNGANVDLRSDLYSLGVTFFHVLAGEPPFRAETALALAYKHLNEEPPPLRELRPDLPSALIEVIERLMAKEPANRFPDAKSALTELKRIETSGEVNKTSIVTNQKPANWWTSLPISSQALRAYAIGCLVVFLLAAGMGRRDRRRPNPLDSVPAAPRVPLRETASAQVSIARTLASGPTRDNRATEEEAWRLVIERFPDVPQATLEAQLELGLLQLAQRRYSDALSHFDELARQHDNAWKARGVAGQATLASVTGRYAESHELIALELVNLREHLDERMTRLVREAIGNNNRNRDSSDPDLEGLFAPLEPGERE